MFLIIVSTIARVTGGMFRLSEKFSTLDSFSKKVFKNELSRGVLHFYALKNICPRVSLVFSKKEISLRLIDISRLHETNFYEV